MFKSLLKRVKCFMHPCDCPCDASIREEIKRRLATKRAEYRLKNAIAEQILNHPQQIVSEKSLGFNTRYFFPRQDSKNLFVADLGFYLPVCCQGLGRIKVRYVPGDKDNAFLVHPDGRECHLVCGVEPTNSEQRELVARMPMCIPLSHCSHKK